MLPTPPSSKRPGADRRLRPFIGRVGRSRSVLQSAVSELQDFSPPHPSRTSISPLSRVTWPLFSCYSLITLIFLPPHHHCSELPAHFHCPPWISFIPPIPPPSLTLRVFCSKGAVMGWWVGGQSLGLCHPAGLSHLPPPLVAIHLHKHTLTGKPQHVRLHVSDICTHTQLHALTQNRMYKKKTLIGRRAELRSMFSIMWALETFPVYAISKR